MTMIEPDWELAGLYAALTAVVACFLVHDARHNDPGVWVTAPGFVAGVLLTVECLFRDGSKPRNP